MFFNLFMPHNEQFFRLVMNGVSLRTKLVLIFSFIVIFYIVFALYSDIEKIIQHYQQLNLIFVIPILSIIISVSFFASLRQQYLLNNLGIKLSIKQNYLLFLVGLSMIITPLGSGQLIKSHYIEQKFGFKTAKSTPLVLSERFADISATVLIIISTLFFYFSFVSIILVTLLAIILFTVFLAFSNKTCFNFLLSLSQKIPILKNIPEIFSISVANLFNWKILSKTIIFTIPIILLEGFAIYLGFLAFDINLGYIQSIQIFYSSLLLGSLTFIPGGVGLTESGFVGLLLQHNFELGLATSLIIFIRLTTIWFSTISGFIATLIFKFKI